ncbi:GL18963 [Drosophila persimilis]|uniref:GL18963 n=1 Tax=Drosophila persimilis TaxID=7234 RepID=B4G7L4_DROPE|nr:GL18963 [Drosophila persimilis]
MPATVVKKPAAKKLPAVPESKLKFSKKQISKRAAESKRRLKRAAVIALRKKENLVRAEKYQNEYIKSDQREIKLRRLAKKRNQFYVPAEAKLAFVVRIRGGLIYPTLCPKIESYPISPRSGSQKDRSEPKSQRHPSTWPIDNNDFDYGNQGKGYAGY